MLEPDQWDSILGSVTGTIVHGSERVSSNRLMDLLGVENAPTRRREVGKRLVSVMRANGWQGPRPMRIPGDNGHVAGCSGYWRSAFRPRQPTVSVEGDVESDVESLSGEPERRVAGGARAGHAAWAAKAGTGSAGASGYNGFESHAVAGDGGRDRGQRATSRATAKSEGSGRRVGTITESNGGGKEAAEG